MFKKLVGKPIDADCIGKIKDNLEERHFWTKEVFSHGFPHHPTALGYDVLQSLIAIGNNRGTIRIFGRAGLEVCLQHEPSVCISQLIFITNKGYLISVTGDDIICLWSLREQPARITYELQLRQEKVTKCSHTYGSDWLYVGTDESDVHLVQVEGLVPASYTIHWNQVAESQGITRNRPGAVVDILEHPLDQGKVLLGYASGLIVLWNLVTKQVEHRYRHTEMLKSMCWMNSGKEFAASFSNGVIGIWSVNSNKGPNKLFTPVGTTKGTPKRKPPSSISFDTFNPIEKLQWMNIVGNPLFVFTGGAPVEYVTPFISLMQGKSLLMLACDSPIIDFIAIPSSPYIDAQQKPEPVLVLCEEELLVLGNQHYNVPFALDLHKPAVISIEYLNECPHNIISSLNSIWSKQAKKNKEPWPFNGGKWSRSNMKSLPSDLIITGHCDGSIKFWIANSASLQPSITINTLESFERTPIGNRSGKAGQIQPTSPDKNTLIKTKPTAMVTPKKGITSSRNVTPSSDQQQTTPQVKLDLPQEATIEDSVVITESKEFDKSKQLCIINSPDLDGFDIIEWDDAIASVVPMSEYFPVSHVILNDTDWSLIVINIGLCVMLYTLQSFKPKNTIKSLTVKFESSNTHDVTNSPGTDCGWRVVTEAPVANKGEGFYLQFCCQCVPPVTMNDGPGSDVAITCAEYSSKFGILVIGLTCGLVIVDTVDCKCLLVEVNEFNFIGDALGNKKGWGAKKNATAFIKGKKAGHKLKADKQSVKLKIAPLTAATTTPATADLDEAAATVSNVSKENFQLCINTVSIVELNIDKHSHTPTGCIWVGTNNGNIIMMTIHLKSSATNYKNQSRTLELLHNGIAHRLHYPTVSMSFLSDTGGIISTSSQEKQSLSHANLSNITNTSEEMATTGDTRITQYAVLCSEILCKVYVFPDNSKLTMNELVDKSKTAIAKTTTCQISGCPSLICLTFSSTILIHSLPTLRPIAVIPYEPLHELRVLKTFHVAANGSSAVYMYSPSEIQQLSLLKFNEVNLANVMPELYTEVADPEIPSSKGVLTSLFGDSRRSVVDRKELFGKNAGHPSHGIGKTPHDPLNVQKGPVGNSKILSHAKEALSERKEKLGDIAEHTDQMQKQASAYEDAARALREKYANRKWWQL